MNCKSPSASKQGYLACHLCGLVMHAQVGNLSCPRCGSEVHARKPQSIALTWAYLLTAILLYIPANVLPIMQTSYLGQTNSDTIFSGVMLFIAHGDWPIAIVIFTASVLVPMFKVFVLVYLLISVQRRSLIRSHERTRFYRFTELIGRWSMIDVFVVAVLTALVHIGNLASIQPGWGATAFAGVVIFTMLAANAFDPRLIWDHQRELARK